MKKLLPICLSWIILLHCGCMKDLGNINFGGGLFGGNSSVIDIRSVTVNLKRSANYVAGSKIELTTIYGQNISNPDPPYKLYTGDATKDTTIFHAVNKCYHVYYTWKITGPQNNVISTGSSTSKQACAAISFDLNF